MEMPQELSEEVGEVQLLEMIPGIMLIELLLVVLLGLLILHLFSLRRKFRRYRFNFCWEGAAPKIDYFIPYKNGFQMEELCKCC
jgi:hypothetical protein